jgi:hypothetical protein
MNTKIVRKELDELKQIVKARYPEAVFRISEGPEPAPRRLWLNVYINSDEMHEVHELVKDRELDVLLKKNFAIYVLPHPLAYLPPGTRNGRTQRGTSLAKQNAERQPRVLRERKTKYRAKPKKRTVRA